MHCIMALALLCSAGRAVEREGNPLGEMPFLTQHSLCKITVCLGCKCLHEVSRKYMSGIILEFT